MTDLIHLLTRTAPGVVADTYVLERRLADCWDQLDGSSASHMAGDKLLNRMESVRWQPPFLFFAIERHAKRASSHATLEHWVVDLHCNTATVTKTEERTLHLLSLRLTVEAAAEDIARAILNGSHDDRIQWEDDGTACVVASWVFARASTFSRTLGRRRMRLSNCVGEVLAEHGWKRCGRNRFRRGNVPAPIAMKADPSDEWARRLPHQGAYLPNTSFGMNSKGVEQ